MKRFFQSFTTLSLVAVLAMGFTGCSEDDNPVTTDNEIAPPTNVKAYSDDKSVGLEWTPSVNELESNFKGYVIRVRAANTTDTMYYELNQKANGVIINQLTNGTIYEFFVHGATTKGKLSSNYTKITWAPAVRQMNDKDGNVIKVYATTSSLPSAIDIYNPSGKAEVISQSGAEFAARGDLFVFAENNNDALQIRAPQSAVGNPGPETKFYPDPVNADNLNDYSMTSPFATGSYTATSLGIATGPSSTGKLYFGKLVRNEGEYFFRMLVLRGSNGSLVQGSGDDRYVQLEFSYQTSPDVKYAKRTK